MRLWTIQPLEVVDILEKDGVFTCNTELSENYSDFYDAYNWLVGEMDKRNIPHPNHLTLPIWAWHTRNYQHKKPDLRNIGLGCTGQKCACIEFEIPDELVLLSDYNSWHYVLNKMWFDDSKNEEEWEKLHEWYDNLEPSVRNELLITSWQKIFDVTPRKDEWSSNGGYVQAVFWELKKDMVTDIKYFIAK